MLLAHLLQERGEAEEQEDEAGGEEAVDGGERHRLIRLLVGSRVLKRRRARRLRDAPRSRPGNSHDQPSSRAANREDGVRAP
jgi:hypothetical protein